MAATTAIEWTDKTWNPIVGCSVVSPGCTNCYAMTMAACIEKMFDGRTHYAGTTKPSKAGPVWTGKLALAPEHILTQPLRWRKPARIFVNSMGDLFHDDVPDEWINKVFAIMALAPQHTFQVLTKRAERMMEYMRRRYELPASIVEFYRDEEGAGPTRAWQPPANVWLGVSAEDQARFDERWPALAATPAAIRFISYEPALGPLNIRAALLQKACDACSLGVMDYDNPHLHGRCRCSCHTTPVPDWIIAGGESGRSARPAHPDWFRSLRDQCDAACVPFFFKQWGTWVPLPPTSTRRDWWLLSDGGEHGAVLDLPDGRGPQEDAGEYAVVKTNKKTAGNTLDGRQHLAFPQSPAGKVAP